MVMLTLQAEWVAAYEYWEQLPTQPGGLERQEQWKDLLRRASDFTGIEFLPGNVNAHIQQYADMVCP